MPKKSMSAQATPLVVQEHIQMWGKAIRAQRMVLRLTAAQLASRIGVSVPTVARLEKGDPGVGVGSYLGALFSLGLSSAATPVLNPELWQSCIFCPNWTAILAETGQVFWLKLDSFFNRPRGCLH